MCGDTEWDREHLKTTGKTEPRETKIGKVLERGLFLCVCQKLEIPNLKGCSRQILLLQEPSSGGLETEKGEREAKDNQLQVSSGTPEQG